MKDYGITGFLWGVIVGLLMAYAIIVMMEWKEISRLEETAMTRFGLIGNGIISKRHKEAIRHINGELIWIVDPVNAPEKSNDQKIYVRQESGYLLDMVDYVVICSPTPFHRQQTKNALKRGCSVICEKPLCLPWEPLIDDDRVNVVLQLRWIKDLPKRADLVKAVMVRDAAFFKTWKGDPKQAGGFIYELFIHYIDLAILLGAGFEGEVRPDGVQERKIVSYDCSEMFFSQGTSSIAIRDILRLDMQDLYNRMYEDILQGKGVKPKDIFYLTWVLNQQSAREGFNVGGMGKTIRIEKGQL
jgi:hypothetical protein